MLIQTKNIPIKHKKKTISFHFKHFFNYKIHHIKLTTPHNNIIYNCNFFFKFNSTFFFQQTKKGEKLDFLFFSLRFEPLNYICIYNIYFHFNLFYLQKSEFFFQHKKKFTRKKQTEKQQLNSHALCQIPTFYSLACALSFLLLLFSLPFLVEPFVCLLSSRSENIDLNTLTKLTNHSNVLMSDYSN